MRRTGQRHPPGMAVARFCCEPREMATALQSLRSLAWLYQFCLTTSMLSCLGGVLKILACLSMPEAGRFFFRLSPLVITWSMFSVGLSAIAVAFVAMSGLPSRLRVMAVVLTAVGGLLLVTAFPCPGNCCVPRMTETVCVSEQDLSSPWGALHDSLLIPGFLLLGAGHFIPLRFLMQSAARRKRGRDGIRSGPEKSRSPILRRN